MFRNVGISDSIPRDLSSFNASMTEGLLAMRFFGYFFLISAVILFLIAAFKFKMIAPSLLLLTLAGVGFYFIQRTSKTVQLRKDLFLYGRVVQATVIGHGRAFNIFKSKQDYTITVEVDNTKQRKTIKHAKEDLWRSSPIGDKILGLSDQDQFFFGEQIGVQFTLFK